MKKNSILFVALLVVGLGNIYSYAQTKKPAQTTGKSSGKTSPANTKSGSNDLQQGKELLAKSDCLACHQEQVKIVGPSYVSVAEKYGNAEANVTMLVDKVIKGGSGVWGQVPMPPHPTLAKADATKMIKYIVSLKAK